MPLAAKFIATTMFFGLLGPVVGSGLFIAYVFMSSPDFLTTDNPIGDIVYSIIEFGLPAMFAGGLFSTITFSVSKIWSFDHPKLYGALIGIAAMAFIFSIPFILDLANGYGAQPRELIFSVFGGVSGLFVALLLPRRFMPVMDTNDA